MYPPLFDTCEASPEVRARLGFAPVRIYPHGAAPQGVARPYAVYQIVTGLPANYLGDLPDCDSYTTQVDVYGSDPESTAAAARSMRDALEPVAYVGAWRGQFKDPDTTLYRYSFDVDWQVLRL
ncbi:DUF3168 domain-containing protein [Lysobacter sp. 5GHs7-4]|uniref:tail completion protein gp17 n=1 Tax=Lysobacter sp. 5GHs7-4 TaxID=2904253 RepID=UPI001E2C18BC|nr:DUF3168 domain-containing protein [Lysobacter sp. 5GHs7-4]UHQ21887.1 DUF3168 domain-containing protein [Lysobacter sp. 5GHs7-4]